MNSNPDAVFAGNDVRFDDVLDYVKRMTPRALTTDALTDVIDILDYTRAQVLEIHEENERLSRALADKQAFLTRREAELAIKMKALRLVQEDAPAPKRRSFWR